MSLEIQTSDLGASKLLRLVGRLDTETSADFELAAYDAHQAGSRQFVVDLSEITYVSSAGLRVLLALAKKLEGNGELKLAGIRGVVKEVFEKSGFARLFTIFPDVQSAAGAAPGAPAPQRSSVQNDAAKLLGAGNSRPMSPVVPAVQPQAQGFFAKILAMLGLGKK
jgi:anti-anti-sigma factor